MAKSSSNKKPTFVWQALLIVLPIIVLAVVCFFSLRQDKLLAEQEARERAQAIADELRAQLWTSLTNEDTQTDPSMPLRFQVDDSGQLLFPPMVAPLPVPPPLSLAELNQGQFRLWQLAQQAEITATNSTQTAKAYADFLSLSPPEDFAGVACYSLGLVLARQGEHEAAADMFRRCAIEHPKAVGESGLPLQPLARLKLLGLETNGPTADLRSSLDSFCSNLVYRPFPLTEHLLHEASVYENVSGLKSRPWPFERPPTNYFLATRGVAEKWQSVWQDHERERQLSATASLHFGRAGLPFGNADEMVLVPRQRPKRSWALQPSSSVESPAEPANARNSNAPAPRLFWFTTTEDWPSALTNVPQINTNNDPRPPDFQQDWLAVRREGASTSWWFVCRTRPQLGRELTGLLNRSKQIPDYFGIGFSLDGRLFARDPFKLELWNEHHYGGKGGGWDRQFSGEAASAADLLGSAALEEGGKELLKVNVYLTSPATLFARQSARTFWFSSLIAASAAAALIGLIAAWRAFHRQQQLSELKSNFVSSVSHELRAPVASVRLMAESLERGKISELPKQQEYFRFIAQECRRLSSLVENVLDFSRIEQGRKEYEFEPTDLLALTQQTVKLMEPYAAERQVTLAFTPPDPQPSANNYQLAVDGKAIQQALVNLIDNAIKHSPKGGTVSVGLGVMSDACRVTSEASDTTSSPDWFPPATRHSPLVTLSVEDHGDGIPSEEHEKIFERFYRSGSELRRQTQGVGIGLSIVKHIVEAHGGKVRVRSVVGEGSTFTIELPRTNDE